MSDDPQPSMPTAPSDPQARLRAAVAAFPAPGFAVIDGAHFDEVTALFRRDRLFARSLYLDTADPEIQAAGPWLVALDQAPDATDRVFALVGDKPAVVFWCCDGGERVLWRHLRTLNMALIPQWAADGGAEPLADGSGQEPTAVTFRHYDPRVLGALMPCLDTAQFARVLGPAQEVVFLTDLGKMRRLVSDRGWPPAQAGLLSLRSDQCTALIDRRVSVSHQRIVDYLREVAPEATASASDAELIAFVRQADTSGRQLGVRSEAAHMRWAYLLMVSEGRVLRTPGAVNFIKHGNSPPDEQVRTMIDLITDRLRLLSDSAGAP